MIVPIYSQSGYIDKSAAFSATSHSFPSLLTETNSTSIQIKVNELLLSDDSTEFARGFPAPSSQPLDCYTTNELLGIAGNANFVNSEQSFVQTNEDNKYVQIDSALRGTTYLQRSEAKITLSFNTKNGVIPTSSIFMVEGIGWYLPTNISPDTVSFILPSDAALGKRNIVLMVEDTTGILLGDTSHIVIVADGSLDSIWANPNPVVLDSVLRETNVSVHGYFKVGNLLNDEDISSGSTGTKYTSLKGTSIFKVSNDGTVTATAVGIDTLIIENNSKEVRIPVMVDSNYSDVVKYPNVIDFPQIQNKVLGDEPFGLNATVTSGEEITYTLISGPVDLSNGIITIKGLGTATIKATSIGNAYFEDATSVERTFVITGSLPIHFINFSGTLINNDVHLNWQTAQEQNASYFIIERSVDALHFDSINKVNAIGNSIYVSNYIFTDKKVNQLASTNFYYRIKEVDKDGKFQYSKIVKIPLSHENVSMVIAPNPATNNLNIYFNNYVGNVKLRIYDLTGRLINMWEQRITGNNTSFNTTKLKSGAYIINAVLGSTTINKTFIKE